MGGGVKRQNNENQTAEKNCFGKKIFSELFSSSQCKNGPNAANEK